MTTPAAERLYLAQHEVVMEGKRWAIHNPNSMPVAELPIIYGFNNGGRQRWLEGMLMAEDGTYLGGHICSAEGYMLHDLGILKGTQPDRHEDFRKHYPDGYRMVFLSFKDAKGHAGLDVAFKKNDEKRVEAEADENDPDNERAIHD